MKKMMIIVALFGVLGYTWFSVNDGAYDPNAKYIGNTFRNKFHRVTCKYVKKMDEKNKFYSVTKDKLLNKGMKACKYCRP